MEQELLKLKDYLGKHPAGDLDNDETQEVERLLAACWHEIYTSEDGGLTPTKLLNRAEQLRWDLPILTFDIERHGPTVLGSLYMLRFKGGK